MSITLRHLGTNQTVDLSDRLLWVNEFDWSPAAHEARTGTTGALLLHVGLRQAGRPIELDGRDSQAWLARAICAQLAQWAAQPGQTFELLLRGQARTVVFDNTGADAFAAEPIWSLADGEHTPELWYRPHFKFMEV
jgi:hypothetical protein